MVNADGHALGDHFSIKKIAYIVNYKKGGLLLMYKKTIAFIVAFVFALSQIYFIEGLTNNALAFDTTNREGLKMDASVAINMSQEKNQPVPIKGVKTDVAGFIGEAERGPTTPILIENWAQYQKVFGGSFSTEKYLPFAVKGYFDNGGSELYVARIVDSKAKSAVGYLKSGDGKALTVRAIGEGTWGNRVAIKVVSYKEESIYESNDSDCSKDNNEEESSNIEEDIKFKLEVYYWDSNPAGQKSLYNSTKMKIVKGEPKLVESFDNLSIDENSPDYFGNRVNKVSNYIVLSVEKSDSGLTPDSTIALTYLKNGSDGSSLDVNDYVGNGGSDPSLYKGLTAFKNIDEISILYSPDATKIKGLALKMVEQSYTLRDRFVILDSPLGCTNPDPMRNGSSAMGNIVSSYAAYYYPWIKISVSNSQMVVPPGGYVAGIYARVDNQRGVHKAPANEKIIGAIDLEVKLSNSVVDNLNNKGVNCIRNISGRGILVWGARVLSTEPEFKYISIRRYNNYIQESIAEGLAWTSGWANDRDLWASVNLCIADFLTEEWHRGALLGNNSREAFLVKCDRSTMTQRDIDEDRLIVQAGLAVTRPAEFIVFSISQKVNVIEETTQESDS